MLYLGNETRTKAGDLNILHNPKTNAFDLLKASGSGDFEVIRQNKNYEMVNNLFKEIISEQGSNYEFNKSANEFEKSIKRSNNLDLWGTENNDTSNTISK